MCWKGGTEPAVSKRELPPLPVPPVCEGRGPHRTARSGFCISLSFSIILNILKNKILELEEMRNVPSIQNVSYKTSRVAGAFSECCLQGACKPRIIPMLILRLLRLQLEELLTLSLPKCWDLVPFLIFYRTPSILQVTSFKDCQLY